MGTTKRWQDWVTLALGVWLFISPWVLGFEDKMSAVAWNSYLLGAAVAIFSVVCLYTPKVWEEWLNVAFGVWLIISPWVVGFSTFAAATYNAVAVGILVIGFTLWAMAHAGHLAWRKGHQA
ncbi:MAG: SPW repeat protein [Pseudomonadota bacterium]